MTTLSVLSCLTDLHPWFQYTLARQQTPSDFDPPLTALGQPQLFLSDPETKFSKTIGWTMGDRTARYAIIVDKGKVVYAEKEPGRDVTVNQPLRRQHRKERLGPLANLDILQVSGAESVMARL